MADWNIVRNDPNYIEPLDPEIIPLCDALNAAGFVTTSSCSGHGSGCQWPRVWFEPSDDTRIERMVRFVKATENFDYPPHTTVWQKEILLEGYAWSVEIHLWDVDRDTPWQVALGKAGVAAIKIAQVIRDWSESESSGGDCES